MIRSFFYRGFIMNGENLEKKRNKGDWSMIHIAILGAGNIAGTMAKTLNGMEEKGETFCCYAVAARELERAQTFAEKYGFEKAYGSYEEMLADEKVDFVYIATPHGYHYEHMKLCLEYGKHVLCEKAFTLNAAQAREVFAVAEEKGLLLTEAIWPRYQPMRKILDDLLASGVIGKVHLMVADIAFDSDHVPRMHRPELGGGSLLDITIYPLNTAIMAFGDQVTKVDSSVQLTECGVDAQESVTLHFADGKMAVIAASMYAEGDTSAMFCGENGRIHLENIFNPKSLTVYNRRGEQVETITCPEQITGYEYEVRSCLNAIESGSFECPEMPYKDTIYMLELMDSLRAQWGMKYPCEE